MKTRLESEKQKIEKEQENEKIKIMTAVNMSESERQKYSGRDSLFRPLRSHSATSLAPLSASCESSFVDPGNSG